MTESILNMYPTVMKLSLRIEPRAGQRSLAKKTLTFLSQVVVLTIRLDIRTNTHAFLENTTALYARNPVLYGDRNRGVLREP